MLVQARSNISTPEIRISQGQIQDVDPVTGAKFVQAGALADVSRSRAHVAWWESGRNSDAPTPDLPPAHAANRSAAPERAPMMNPADYTKIETEVAAVVAKALPDDKAYDDTIARVNALKAQLANKQREQQQVASTLTAEHEQSTAAALREAAIDSLLSGGTATATMPSLEQRQQQYTRLGRECELLREAIERGESQLASMRGARSATAAKSIRAYASKQAGAFVKVYHELAAVVARIEALEHAARLAEVSVPLPDITAAIGGSVNSEFSAASHRVQVAQAYIAGQ